jgi:YbbR domain-containing protein
MEKNKESKNRKALQIGASILIAIAIWFYVDSVQAREVTVRIKDVPVQFTGEDTTLADNGLMLLSGYDKTITLNLSGPRNVLYHLRKNEVRIVADTSSITSTGTQTLTYRVIYPDNISSSSLKVISASAYTVTVTVGELDTKDVEIHCNITGSPASGFTTGDLVLDPQVLTLRGQRDDLVNVSYARISVDLNNADTTVTSACEFQLYDYNDVLVDSQSIRPVTKLIQATVPIRTTKTVPLKVDFKEAVGSTLATTKYTIQPENVTLVGSKDTLAGIDSLLIGTVYLQDLGASQTMIFNIEPPEGTALAEGTDTTVSVQITVTGVTEKMVDTTNISFTNVPDGFTVVPAADSLTIAVRGLSSEIDAVTGDQLHVTADLSTCKTSGDHTIPVTVTVNGYSNIGVKGTYKIVVKLAPQ